MRKKLQSLKAINKSNDLKIKVNNEDAKKQITQLQKEINSLKEKQERRRIKLRIINSDIKQMEDEETKKVGGNPKSKETKEQVKDNLAKNKKYNDLMSRKTKTINESKIFGEEIKSKEGKIDKLEGNDTFTKIKEKVVQIKVVTDKVKEGFGKILSPIKNMGIGIKNGAVSLMKYIGSFFSLKNIYSTLKSSAEAWLSSQNIEAQQLSANIDYMKTAMGSVFAPVIMFVTNLVYQLMKAVQSLVYAFTGVNIFAKATATSMNKTAGGASKASKSLSGIHSEINNVSSNESSGGGNNGGPPGPNIDLSQIDIAMTNWTQKVKTSLITFFEPIKNSWDQYGKPLIDGMKYALDSNLEITQSIGKSFGEVWQNGTGEETIGLLIQMLTSVFDICGNISQAYKNAWENNAGTEIIQNLWNGLNNILSIIKDIFKVYEDWTASESFQAFADSIIGIIDTISSWFELLTGKIREVWENGGAETFSKLLEFGTKLIEAIDLISNAVSPVIEWVLNVVTPIISGVTTVIGHIIDALSGVLDFIIGVFTGDWERAWSGIKEFFSGIWEAIKTIIGTVIDIIKNIISSVFNTIKDIIVNIWNGIVTTIANVWNNIITKVKEGVSGAWNAITSVFGNITGWFRDKFTQAWSAVKNVFSAGGKIFDGIKDGIVNAFKSVVNAIIRGINKVISIPFNAINGVLSGIRNISIAGIEPFTWIHTFNVPQIPELATGNVAYERTLAMFGEYSGANSNPEITTPQNIMRETFNEVLESREWNNNKQPVRVQIYWGTKAVVDEIIDGINEKTRQTGKAQIKVAYA